MTKQQESSLLCTDITIIKGLPNYKDDHIKEDSFTIH